MGCPGKFDWLPKLVHPVWCLVLVLVLPPAHCVSLVRECSDWGLARVGLVFLIALGLWQQQGRRCCIL